MDFVSLGHILKETITGRDGSEQLVLGGPAAYSSACASRLGAKVGIVSRIGADMPGSLLRVLTDAGVDISGLEGKGAFTTSNLLGYDNEGRKRILSYSRKAGSIKWEHVPHDYYGSKAFYICGVDFEIEIDVIKRISKLDKLVAGDLGGLGGTGRPLGSLPPVEENPALFREIVSSFKIVKTSEDDCMLVTGGDLRTVNEFIMEILTWGPEVVLLTRGAEGVDIVTESNVRRIPSIPGNPADTTGAGDCFMAGFLYRYVNTWDLVDAVTFGTAVASLVIEATGGVRLERMPTARQVEERLAAK